MSSVRANSPDCTIISAGRRYPRAVRRRRKVSFAIGGVLLLAGWTLALSGAFNPLAPFAATLAYLLLLLRSSRRSPPKVGEPALEDRTVLNRIGGELSDGVATLEQAARRVQVEPPMLAAALQRAHGAVPGPK
jgi:hypothetical protein